MLFYSTACTCLHTQSLCVIIVHLIRTQSETQQAVKLTSVLAFLIHLYSSSNQQQCLSVYICKSLKCIVMLSRLLSTVWDFRQSVFVYTGIDFFALCVCIQICYIKAKNFLLNVIENCGYKLVCSQRCVWRCFQC